MKKKYRKIEDVIRNMFHRQNQLENIWYLLLIQDVWEQLPPPIVRNTKPIYFQNGTVTVLVPSSVWKVEINFKKIELLKHLAKELPEVTINDLFIKIEHGRRNLPDPPKPKVEKKKLTIYRPTQDSPAWNKIVKIRERALEIDKPWTKYFLDITDLYLNAPEE
jgi:Dna[CI] antecedent, DciA